MSLLTSNLNIRIVEIKNMSWDISSVTVAPRPYHALVFRKEGKANFICAGKSFSTDAGEVFYMPAALEYHASYKEANSITVIHFESDYKGDAENFKANDFASIGALFERALRVWEDKETGYYYSAVSIIYEILARFQRSKENLFKSAYYASFFAALDYADSHYTDCELSANTLIEMSHMSGTYFRKLFIERFGKSPCEYIVSLRLGHAKKLLASGKYSVNEAALLSGFSDPKYFSRIVKKAYGVSPSRLYKHTPPNE